MQQSNSTKDNTLYYTEQLWKILYLQNKRKKSFPLIFVREKWCTVKSVCLSLGVNIFHISPPLVTRSLERTSVCLFYHTERQISGRGLPFHPSESQNALLPQTNCKFAFYTAERSIRLAELVLLSHVCILVGLPPSLCPFICTRRRKKQNLKY